MLKCRSALAVAIALTLTACNSTPEQVEEMPPDNNRIDNAYHQAAVNMVNNGLEISDLTPISSVKYNIQLKDQADSFKAQVYEPDPTITVYEFGNKFWRFKVDDASLDHVSDAHFAATMANINQLVQEYKGQCSLLVVGKADPSPYQGFGAGVSLEKNKDISKDRAEALAQKLLLRKLFPEVPIEIQGLSHTEWQLQIEGKKSQNGIFYRVSDKADSYNMRGGVVKAACGGQ